MDDRYFVVELTNGVVVDFNKKCDKVKYADPVYTVFSQLINPTTDQYSCLAIIPHSSIFAITTRKKEES